jgi:hypothetical protein
VLGCGSGCSLCASRPCCASLPHASGPIILSFLSLVLHPTSSCSWWQFRVLLCWQTWVSFGYRAGVMGVYPVGIPLQGSPSALHMLFVCCLSFVHHLFIECCLYIVRLSFVCCHTSFIHCLYVVIRHLYAIRLSSFIHRLYIVVCHSSLYIVVHHLLFFIFHMLSLWQ